MKKVVAIDINDVIRDNIRQFIKYYKIDVDQFSEIEYDDMTSFNFDEVLLFESKEDYFAFKYNDFPYELFSRAELTTENVVRDLNNWVQNDLSNTDCDETPHLSLFSPLEDSLTIQATYSFLARVGVRSREMYFPVDSTTMWDRCDVMITANPNLIELKPEGKMVIKINTPYNKDIDCEYSFDSLEDLLKSEDNVIIKFLEENN